jgi:hypothetical protein
MTQGLAENLTDSYESFMTFSNDAYGLMRKLERRANRRRFLRRVGFQVLGITFVGTRRATIVPGNPRSIEDQRLLQRVAKGDEKKDQEIFSAITSKYPIPKLAEIAFEELGLDRQRIESLIELHGIFTTEALRLNPFRSVPITFAAGTLIAKTVPKEVFYLFGQDDELYGWYQLFVLLLMVFFLNLFVQPALEQWLIRRATESSLEFSEKLLTFCKMLLPSEEERGPTTAVT